MVRVTQNRKIRRHTGLHSCDIALRNFCTNSDGVKLCQCYQRRGCLVGVDGLSFLDRHCHNNAVDGCHNTCVAKIHLRGFLYDFTLLNLCLLLHYFRFSYTECCFGVIKTFARGSVLSQHGLLAFEIQCCLDEYSLFDTQLRLVTIQGGFGIAQGILLCAWINFCNQVTGLDHLP